MVTEVELEYHLWANKRLLEFIDDDVFLKNVKSVFPSLAAVFEHIYTVDTLWINRMSEKHEPPGEVKIQNPQMAIQLFEQNHQRLIEILTRDETVHYKNSKGEVFQNSIQEILRHLINHGTYHRGNVTAMLHQLSGKSISTDYIYYLRER